ncbi:MAG TPA: endo-1,4-beta-xylanase [Polyangiaceae bacterium]|nr:endo-1,4-beta-xylanase [Polyangiaceae bacterium]
MRATDAFGIGLAMVGATALGSACVDYSNMEPSFATLRQAAQAQGKLIGTAVDGALLSTDSEYARLLAEEFSAVTPENATKWGPLEPQDDTYDFSDADSIVAAALDHDQSLKGHVFTWHQQLPSWVESISDPDELRLALREHMETTMARYRGQIKVWDVVNEAVDDNAPAGYRENIFYELLGPDYIEEAFLMAHEADPDALLYYNDYAIERMGHKADFTYQMLRDLVARDIPIHGIGMQSHLSVHRYPAADDLRDNIRRFADLGLRVEISELDGRTSGLTGTLDQQYEAQRIAFQETVASCVLEPGCARVTLWGFLDEYSWLDDEGTEEHGLLFDDNYEKKPSYWGVMDGLRGKLAKRGPTLVKNGDFEDELDHWVGVDSTLSLESFEDQAHPVACARDRSSSESGLSQVDLLDAFASGGSFTFRAEVRQEGTAPAGINVALIVEQSGQDPSTLSLGYLYLEEGVWRTMRGSFALAWEAPPTSVRLSFSGPDPGVDLCITQVALNQLHPAPG